MSQALKELFSPAMIQSLADEIETHAPQFDKNAFKAAIFNQALYVDVFSEIKRIY